MGIFKLYKTRLLAMRRGEYFFERQMYTQYKANRYLGYQVTGMTIQYLMTLVIMIIIIVPLVVLVVLLVLPTTGHARSGARTRWLAALSGQSRAWTVCLVTARW
jgi:uncharacterized membrane protein